MEVFDLSKTPNEIAGEERGHAAIQASDMIQSCHYVSYDESRGERWEGGSGSSLHFGKLTCGGEGGESEAW